MRITYYLEHHLDVVQTKTVNHTNHHDALLKPTYYIKLVQVNNINGVLLSKLCNI